MFLLETPLANFLGRDGKPLHGGRILLGMPSSNPEFFPIAAYWDAALTQPAPQPLRTLNGFIHREGTPANVHIGADYSMLVLDADGIQVAYFASAAAYSIASTVRLDLADAVDVAKGDALIGVKRSTTGTVATTLHNWIDRQELDVVADFGIVNGDGLPKTAGLLAMLSSLGAVGYRGSVSIPYGLLFNVATVYAAVPTGITLNDHSGVNWGQPPGYRNRFRVEFSGDAQADDSQRVIGSQHHPAFMLLNMGTAGSSAALNRYATILHGVGKDADGDPMLGWIQQFAKDPASTKWRVSWRLQTPYLIALGNPTAWTASQTVGPGAYRTSDVGKVYRTAAGGVCGSTAPTGTGTAINDGAVLWDYVQAAINIDATRLDLTEDGSLGQYGGAADVVTLRQSSGARSHSISIDGTTNDITWMDITRGLNVLGVSNTLGLVFGTSQSANRLAMTGATPVAPATGAGKVTQSGATSITSMALPAGLTTMRVELRFDDALSTLVHNTAAANQFRLKGAVNALCPSGGYILLEKDPTATSVWQEIYRSF